MDDPKDSPTGTDNPYLDMLHDAISSPAKMISGDVQSDDAQDGPEQEDEGS